MWRAVLPFCWYKPIQNTANSCNTHTTPLYSYLPVSTWLVWVLKVLWSTTTALKVKAVFFNRGSTKPKGSLNGIQGFHQIESRNGNETTFAATRRVFCVQNEFAVTALPKPRWRSLKRSPKVTSYIPRWFTCPQMFTHPSTNPAVHSWESNSQPVDHESDALTKPRHRFPWRKWALVSVAFSQTAAWPGIMLYPLSLQLSSVLTMPTHWRMTRLSTCKLYNKNIFTHMKMVTISVLHVTELCREILLIEATVRQTTTIIKWMIRSYFFTFNQQTRICATWNIVNDK